MSNLTVADSESLNKISSLAADFDVYAKIFFFLWYRRDYDHHQLIWDYLTIVPAKLKTPWSNSGRPFSILNHAFLQTLKVRCSTLDMVQPIDW